MTDKFVAPITFGINKLGNPFFYISDAIADSDDASATAIEWAYDLVKEDEDEHYMKLTLDIPASVMEVLDVYNEGSPEEIIISTEYKSKLDVLRTQLMDSIKLFDRVQWRE
jgi:hypothetical protein